MTGEEKASVRRIVDAAKARMSADLGKRFDGNDDWTVRRTMLDELGSERLPGISRLDCFFRRCHQGMMNNASHGESFIHGALELALWMGLMTGEQATWWRREITMCPDPDHGGGRSWCAMCGEVCRWCGDVTPRCEKPDCKEREDEHAQG